MGALIVILGGAVGFAIAFASWLAGASLLWSLVIYAAAGNAVAAWLLMRLQRDEAEDEAYLRREIDTEIAALQELRAEAAQGGAQNPGLFGAMRLQGQGGDHNAN